jgi:hypothetical protein
MPGPPSRWYFVAGIDLERVTAVLLVDAPHLAARLVDRQEAAPASRRE